jgi:hypothetical protein
MVAVIIETFLSSVLAFSSFFVFSLLVSFILISFTLLLAFLISSSLLRSLLFHISLFYFVPPCFSSRSSFLLIITSEADVHSELMSKRSTLHFSHSEKVPCSLWQNTYCMTTALVKLLIPISVVLITSDIPNFDIILDLFFHAV